MGTGGAGGAGLRPRGPTRYAWTAWSDPKVVVEAKQPKGRCWSTDCSLLGDKHKKAEIDPARLHVDSQ